MALAKALPQVAELGPLARPSANGRMRDVRQGASTRLIFVGLLALRLVDGSWDPLGIELLALFWQEGARPILKSPMSIMGEKEDAIDYWTKVVETKKMLGSDVKPIWCHPWSPEESHVHLPRKEAEEYRQNFIKVGLI